jgi:hypothetical protein
VHERLSGFFGKGTRAEPPEPSPAGRDDGSSSAGAPSAGAPSAGAPSAGAPSAGAPSAGATPADLERRARELEQRAVDLDDAVRQATADLTAARRARDDAGRGEERRVAELEEVLARLRRESVAWHERALAARLRADEAADLAAQETNGVSAADAPAASASNGGGGGAGRPHGPSATGGRGTPRPSTTGRGEDGLPVRVWHQPGGEWTDLLAAALDEDDDQDDNQDDDQNKDQGEAPADGPASASTRGGHAEARGPGAVPSREPGAH